MKFLHALLLVPALLLAACSNNAKLTPPDGFAELETGDAYSYRATSASGVVLAVRSESNDPRGNLDFWSSALKNRLEKSGYRALEEKVEKITTDEGLVGHRHKYTIDRSGRPHEYWVTVFVTEDRVVVVEAAGDQAFFTDEVRKQVDVATRTVHAG